MTFTSTNVTATAISTAAASSPSIATTAAGAAFSSAPSTSSGNSFSRNSSRRRSNSKSGSISTVCMLCWALTKGYGSGTLRKHSRSIVRITAERSIPDFWLAPIYIYIYIHVYAGGMIGEKQEMNQQINDGHMMGIWWEYIHNII